MFALDHYRKWQVQNIVRGEFSVRSFTHDHPTLAETDELVERLKPIVEQTRYGEGVDYMARLLIHRCRLQLLELLQFDNSIEDPEQIWPRTSLDLIHENAWALQRDGKIFSSAGFLRGPYVTENLPGTTVPSGESKD